MIKCIEREKKHAFDVYTKREIAIVRGKGAEVWDANGRKYIDCVAGHGVANIGHCHRKVVQAISEQAQKLITCPNIFYNDKRALLLEKLINVAPANLKTAFLCNSGAESIEAAIKLARYTTGKAEIICAMRGFHGRTLGALSATFNPNYRKDFEPLLPGFHFVPFNKFEKLHERIDENTAAVLLEVVQGEGGVHIGKTDYLQKVQDLCTSKNILLIIDEIQTGFCRTGKMFASEHFGLQPDMMCVAKAMAGGAPMGAVLCADKIKAPKGKHGTTFGGNPLACAAAIASIEVMLEQDLARQAREKGEYLLQQLGRYNFGAVRQIRQIGLMIGIELKVKSQPYLLKLMDEGVLALPAGATVIRLLPPLIIGYEALDFVIGKLAKVLS